MRWWRERLPRSLSARLVLAYLAAWLLAVALFSLGLAWFRRDDPERGADHSALELAVYLAAQLSLDPQGQPLPVRLPVELGWLLAQAPLDFGYRVFDAQGRVRLWSSPQIEQAWSAAALPAEARYAHGPVELGGLALRLRTLPAGPAGSGLWLQVGVSERLVALAHAGTGMRVRGLALFMGLASVALLGLVQFLVLRRLMRPIQRISEQARQLDLSRPGLRLDSSGLPLEMQPLLSSFNEGLQRLEEAHGRHLQFLADAAHELKTPLALLRAQLELGEVDARVLLHDVDQLSRQVQQWLLLAEVTEPRGYRMEALDPGDIAAEVMERLAPLAERSGVRLRLRMAAEQAASQRCDRSALFVLLKNLVENAIGFAPAGSEVLVEIDAAGLRVRDQGPGIAAAHLPQLFERFWRAPARRDVGAGLGLAICHEVAQAHGWRLAARNVLPGAEFSLNF